MLSMIVFSFGIVSPVLADKVPLPNPELPDSCGLDIVLVIDSSASVDGIELGQLKDAFLGFVDKLLPSTPTEMAVVNFSTSASVLQGFTSNVTDLETAINTPVSNGSTNWDDGLYKARVLFPNRVGNADLIIFASDGNPNQRDGHTGLHGDGIVDAVSEADAMEWAIAEANAAKTAGVRIIALGIGDSLNISNLEDISSSDAVIISDFDDLADDLLVLADELCQNGGDECCNTGDDVIKNGNMAFVSNHVFAGSNTGRNFADGSYGGSGGDGGDIRNGDVRSDDGGDVRDSSTGRGGDGGNGAAGGMIVSGNATTVVTVLNDVNRNMTDVDRCCGEVDCDEGECPDEGLRVGGDVRIINCNMSLVGSGVIAFTNTGRNDALGSYAGAGGGGGNIMNGGEGNVDGGEEGSGAGDGGTGGNAGVGAYVQTGDASLRTSVISLVNTNITRIRR